MIIVFIFLLSYILSSPVPFRGGKRLQSYDYLFKQQRIFRLFLTHVCLLTESSYIFKVFYRPHIYKLKEKSFFCLHKVRARQCPPSTMHFHVTERPFSYARGAKKHPPSLIRKNEFSPLSPFSPFWRKPCGKRFSEDNPFPKMVKTGVFALNLGEVRRGLAYNIRIIDKYDLAKTFLVSTNSVTRISLYSITHCSAFTSSSTAKLSPTFTMRLPDRLNLSA